DVADRQRGLQIPPHEQRMQHLGGLLSALELVVRVVQTPVFEPVSSQKKRAILRSRTDSIEAPRHKTFEQQIHFIGMRRLIRNFLVPEEVILIGGETRACLFGYAYLVQELQTISGIEAADELGKAHRDAVHLPLIGAKTQRLAVLVFPAALNQAIPYR